MEAYDSGFLTKAAGIETAVRRVEIVEVVGLAT